MTSASGLIEDTSGRVGRLFSITDKYERNEVVSSGDVCVYNHTLTNKGRRGAGWIRFFMYIHQGPNDAFL